MSDAMEEKPLKRIYLSPNCCDEVERMWSEYDPGTCDECGAQSTEYVLSEATPARSDAMEDEKLTAEERQNCENIRSRIKNYGATGGEGYLLAIIDRLTARPATAAITHLEAQLKAMSAGHDYLLRLWKLVAPQCEPLPTLGGLATQFDNYITGLQARAEMRRDAE
jgi:hypothetical protein